MEGGRWGCAFPLSVWGHAAGGGSGTLVNIVGDLRGGILGRALYEAPLYGAGDHAMARPVHRTIETADDLGSIALGWK
jgi:hypothetical protein